MMAFLLRPIPMMVGLVVLFTFVVAGFAERVQPALELDRPVMWIDLQAPEFKVPAGVEQHVNLEYARAGEQPLLLDLYRPAGDACASDPWPVVLWIHGGGWRSGDKSEPQILDLVPRGFAVVSFDFRPSDVATFPAQLDDCRDVVRWVRRHAAEYRLDPQRIAAYGISTGAHLAALLGTTADDGDAAGAAESCAVQAVVDFGGQADLLTLDAQVASDSPVRHSEDFSPESLLLGGPLTERADLARQASPQRQISPREKLPPFLIVHGREDYVVPPQQSRELACALRAAGGQATLVVTKAIGHPKILYPELRDQAATFLERALKVRGKENRTAAASKLATSPKP